MKTKIKKVTVHYPLKENEEEFHRRAAKAFAKVLMKEYPSEVIAASLKEFKSKTKK